MPRILTAAQVAPMLSRRFRSFTAVLAFPLTAVISCGGDSPFGPEADLTAAEIQDVFSALTLASDLFWRGSFAMAGAGGAAMMANATEPISETVACPEGGTTSITGSYTYDDNDDSSDIRQSFSSCGIFSESLRLWVFNGRPNIRTTTTSSYNATTEVYTLRGTISGGFSFESGDDSGNCSVNLNITLDESNESFSVSITGTICGQQYSDSFN